MTHEQRAMLMALLAGLPAVLTALIFLWIGEAPAKLQWTLTVLILACWLGVSAALREYVVRPLQTLSNLLGALREGDYSIRARGGRTDEALGLAVLEANTLARTLREQRLGALEAAALLEKVMEEIDVAVFAFDEAHTLRLVNRAGERLLAEPAARLLGRPAAETGLAPLLDGPSPRLVDAALGVRQGRWEVRRSTFRQGGFRHTLLVVSDLSRTLREEERQAWRRLVRVLRHEINNSLAPIKSLAGSLGDLLTRRPRPADWAEDLVAGLDVIGDRAEALSRFMGSYARLTQLPEPRLQPVAIAELVRRAAELETRRIIRVEAGPLLTVSVDPDQIAQLLINIVRNAVDAVEETGGGVTVTWGVEEGTLDLRVVDEGPGVSETTNLFVPFYTTKPDGSGIGLALSRQIAEAHGGTLILQNRSGAPGCEVVLTLPLT